MQKGDLVLIRFPFTDLTGSKLRPAVVLVASGSDVTVCFITTRLQWAETADVLLPPSEETGIKKTSLIRTNKIATLNHTLALGKIGSLGSDKLTELNTKLKQLLQLD